MDMTTAFWYVAGVMLLLILVQVFARPLEWLVRALASSIVGGVALWALNLLGGLLHFQVGVNPVSAAVAGVLGVPGVVALMLMRMILG